VSSYPWPGRGIAPGMPAVVLNSSPDTRSLLPTVPAQIQQAKTKLGYIWSAIATLQTLTREGVPKGWFADTTIVKLPRTQTKQSSFYSL
jgi:hypothetical protein